jgi:putative hydroxymethylpyrimidine transport system substrate-binding protein
MGSQIAHNGYQNKLTPGFATAPDVLGRIVSDTRSSRVMSAEKMCIKTAACAAWFAAFFLTAGVADAADKIKMALLTVPLIWDAGVFAAVDHKFFEAEGLEIEFVSPATPADGLKLLASGGVQFATAHSTEVITARSRGLPVVSIATNHQYGMAGIMTPTTLGVTSLKELEGKTLGITGIPYNRTMLEYCLTNAGVDLSKVNIVIVGFAPMPLLLSKRIDGLGDAITWSEPAMFNIQLGKPADDKSTYKYWAFYQNGLPRYYTLGVVASEDTVNKNPELAKRFLRAWVKGLDWAIHNQKEAVDAMRKHSPEINEQEAIANFAEIARISQSPDTQAHGLGWQDPAVWAKQEEFMREHNVIPGKVDISQAMTDKFLPGK